jgi:Type IV secretion system pilin
MNGLQGVIHTFDQLTTIGLNIGLAAAAFFILVGGFQYMSAGGNPMSMERAKSSLKNAAIGFAIVLLARTLAQLLQSSITGS